MNKKFILIIFILFFITNCGFQPIYSNNENSNIYLKINNIEGDREINNLIKQNLTRYQKTDAKNKFDLEIFTDFKKMVLSKNTSGVIVNYRLIISTKFEVDFKGNKKTIIITEKFDINKDSNLFEEKNYEKQIKRNLSNLITQRFITQLVSLQ